MRNWNNSSKYVGKVFSIGDFSSYIINPRYMIMIYQLFDFNVVDFRNLSHNSFTNMTSMSTDVINYAVIDLSNNFFSNFTISSNSSLPNLDKM